MYQANNFVVKTLILTGYGINCEEEIGYCFKKAGSKTTILHINELLQSPSTLSEYDILAIPGGFSYGDHISSGKNFANKIRFNIMKEFNEFVSSGKPVIGICNGYQVLVKLGTIPDINNKQQQELTFTHNDNNSNNNNEYHSKFENRWVNLIVNQANKSFWINHFNKVEKLELPVRHGEGRLISMDDDLIRKLLINNQIAFFYADKNNLATMEYPYNPNGSIKAIAALTNQQGNVMGIMPHPEAYSIKEHYPNFLAQEVQAEINQNSINSQLDFPLQKGDGVGMIFFYNGVNYVKKEKKIKSIK